MDFRIEKIDADLATSFTDFILPAIRNDPDFDKYSFYGAISNDVLCGILVMDIREFDPEILSIGVSDNYENYGIAKALLSYALSDIFRYFDITEMEDQPNQVSARVVANAGGLGKMDYLLTNAGFEPVSRGEFCQITIKNLKENKYLQNPKVISKINKPGSKTRFLSLKDTPGNMINVFSNMLVQNDLFPGIETGDLDEDLTVFGIKDDEICLCILFLKENNGVVQNNFLYQMKTEGMGNIELLHLLSKSATCAINKFDDDVALNFWIADDIDITRKMLDQFFPEAVCTQESVTYELPFSKLKALRDRRFTDDMELHALSNEDTVCAKCKYCMADSVMECEKYLQKPDAIFEGGECELFNDRSSS